jgi:hypothetical protein
MQTPTAATVTLEVPISMGRPRRVSTSIDWRMGGLIMLYVVPSPKLVLAMLIGVQYA